jgi:hypothetical protein
VPPRTGATREAGQRIADASAKQKHLTGNAHTPHPQSQNNPTKTQKNQQTTPTP